MTGSQLDAAPRPPAAWQNAGETTEWQSLSQQPDPEARLRGRADGGRKPRRAWQEPRALLKLPVNREGGRCGEKHPDQPVSRAGGWVLPAVAGGGQAALLSQEQRCPAYPVRAPKRRAAGGSVLAGGGVTDVVPAVPLGSSFLIDF